MKLSTLASVVQGKLLGDDVSYTTVNIDSRTIKPGELFLAISGKQWDGHLFLEQAKERGATAALVEKSVPSSLPLVQVRDTRKALGQIAKQHRLQFSLPIIALTGSCGKTTTKEMLRAILSESGSVLASTKSFNNDIGVPLTLLSLSTQHRFAVIEMGTNHLGEIAYLSDMTRPNIALITNIAPAHLEGFGSIAGVVQAKTEIFSGLSSNGIAILNSNDDLMDDWIGSSTFYQIVTFGLSRASDFSAQEVHLDLEGKARFTLVSPLGDLPVYLSLPGKHQVMNALAAAAAASQVGATLVDIKTGLEKVQCIPGRFVITKTKAGAFIIDDTYNANPTSVSVALELFVRYPGQHIFVMGDMAELGDQAAYYHHQVGLLAKKLGIEAMYTYGDLTALTAKAFGPAARHCASQEDLIQIVKPLLNKEIVVLVKGSFSSQMGKVVSALTH